jgi:hypothetical protein
VAKGPEPRSALSAASISVRGALLAFMPAHRLRRPRPRYELGGRPGRNRNDVEGACSARSSATAFILRQAVGMDDTAAVSRGGATGFRRHL